MGEFYWEAARFVPHIIWKRKVQYPNRDIKFVVLTRNDRYDLYGLHVDKIFEFCIEDENSYIQNGYRLDGLSNEKYNTLVNYFRSIASKDYDIIEHIYPDISKSQFCNKQQYKKEEMMYDFLPRVLNGNFVDFYLQLYYPLVVLAPRYRDKMQRNWPYWQELYNLIWNSKLRDDFTFIICGKQGSYIPDKHNRFLDINKIQNTKETSLSGLTIEILKRATFTVGSQSAIPNLSLLFNVPVLEWGHQKKFHTIDYNPFKTPITFLEDMNYNINSKIVFEQMQNLLERIDNGTSN